MNFKLSGGPWGGLPEYGDVRSVLRTAGVVHINGAIDLREFRMNLEIYHSGTNQWTPLIYRTETIELRPRFE